MIGKFVTDLTKRETLYRESDVLKIKYDQLIERVNIYHDRLSEL
jgi:hypothetical protein